MTIVHLVRHGVVATTGKRHYARTPGIHLTDEGEQQAATAAEVLRGFPGELAAVYASPMVRAQETGKIIAKAHGLRIRTEKGINEVDIGDWTNLTFKQLHRKKQWKELLRQPSTFTFPGGEAPRDVQHRVVHAIEKLADRHHGERIAVVSHGDPTCLALAHYLGMALDHYHRLGVTTGSVSTLAFTEGNHPRILGIGITGRELHT